MLKPWEWRILKIYLLALPQNSNLFWTYSFRTQILPFQVCALTYAPFLICLITATLSEQWNKWHGNFCLFNMHCILCGRPAPSLSKFPYLICLHEMWVFLALVKKNKQTHAFQSLWMALWLCAQWIWILKRHMCLPTVHKVVHCCFIGQQSKYTALRRKPVCYR